jgi:hypothetical protein
LAPAASTRSQLRVARLAGAAGTTKQSVSDFGRKRGPPSCAVPLNLADAMGRSLGALEGRAPVPAVAWQGRSGWVSELDAEMEPQSQAGRGKGIGRDLSPEAVIQ